MALYTSKWYASYGADGSPAPRAQTDRYFAGPTDPSIIKATLIRTELHVRFSCRVSGTALPSPGWWGGCRITCGMWFDAHGLGSGLVPGLILDWDDPRLTMVRNASLIAEQADTTAKVATAVWEFATGTEVSKGERTELITGAFPNPPLNWFQYEIEDSYGHIPSTPFAPNPLYVVNVNASIRTLWHEYR